jgi:tryptophan-rich sensory protein
MSAIAPPPIPGVTDEAIQTRLGAARALTSLKGEQSRTHDDTNVNREHSTSMRGRWLGSLVGLVLFGAASAAAAIGGGLVTAKQRNKRWYHLLRKPSFTPPARVFGLVWPVLYSLGALSAWRVARTPPSPARSVALGLWGTQLAFNAAWSPIFFGAHRPRLAMADLAGNYASLGAYALAASKVDTAAAAMVVPYLGWLTFAGVLNASIVGKNRR